MFKENPLIQIKFKEQLNFEENYEEIIIFKENNFYSPKSIKKDNLDLFTFHGTHSFLYQIENDLFSLLNQNFKIENIEITRI